MAQNETSKKIMGRRSFKNIWVDSPMQSRLGLNLVAINFCLVGATILLLYSRIKALQEVIEEAADLTQPTAEALSETFVGILIICFAMAFLSLVVNYLAGIYFAHRFAGPTKVIVDYIDDLIARREPTKRTLRPSDELKLVLNKLNELSESIKTVSK